MCLQFTLNFKIRRGTQFKRQVDLGSPSPAIMIIVTTTTTTATTITITSEITYSMSLINEILKKNGVVVTIVTLPPGRQKTVR